MRIGLIQMEGRTRDNIWGLEGEVWLATLPSDREQSLITYWVSTVLGTAIQGYTVWETRGKIHINTAFKLKFQAWAEITRWEQRGMTLKGRGTAWHKCVDKKIYWTYSLLRGTVTCGGQCRGCKKQRIKMWDWRAEQHLYMESFVSYGWWKTFKYFLLPSVFFKFIFQPWSE